MLAPGYATTRSQGYGLSQSHLSSAIRDVGPETLQLVRQRYQASACLSLSSSSSWCWRAACCLASSSPLVSLWKERRRRRWTCGARDSASAPVHFLAPPAAIVFPSASHSSASSSARVVCSAADRGGAAAARGQGREGAAGAGPGGAAGQNKPQESWKERKARREEAAKRRAKKERSRAKPIALTPGEVAVQQARRAKRLKPPRRGVKHSDVEMLFSRSSGPGGQNVNKVETKVEVRFDIDTAEFLPGWVKKGLKEKQASRINKSGQLILTCQESRSQSMNVKVVMERLQGMIDEASTKPQMPDGAKRRRIHEAKKRADEKRLYDKRFQKRKRERLSG